MNTQFLHRTAEQLKKPRVQSHLTKAAGGLTVASVVWIYSTFATSRELQRTNTVLHARLTALAGEVRKLHLAQAKHEGEVETMELLLDYYRTPGHPVLPVRGQRASGKGTP